MSKLHVYEVIEEADRTYTWLMSASSPERAEQDARQNYGIADDSIIPLVVRQVPDDQVIEIIESKLWIKFEGGKALGIAHEPLIQTYSGAAAAWAAACGDGVLVGGPYE